MEFASTSNSNNRKLQERLKGFQNRELQPETRPIKSFPKFHPKEAIEHREKMRRIGLIRRIVSFMIYLFVFIIVLIIVYRFQ